MYSYNVYHGRFMVMNSYNVYHDRLVVVYS